MKKMRQVLMVLTITIFSIWAFPISSSAVSNKNIKVAADLTPSSPSYFSLNFDGISFTGKTGSGLLSGKPASSEKEIDVAKYTISTDVNFNVYISGTNLKSKDGKELSSERIIINQYSSFTDGNKFGPLEGTIRLKKTPTKLYSGSYENGKEHYLLFQLDVDKHNQFNDGDVISNLDGNTLFDSDITLTYIGL